MRVQRSVEAAFLIAAFFTGDVRFAYVTLGLSVLQAISGRLVPVALAVALFTPARRTHELSDLYFDLKGTRGACAISMFVQLGGIALVHAGRTAMGFMVLTIPTASFVLAPSVGFCCGCALYVISGDALARLGVVKRHADGACDVDIGRTDQAPGHQR